MLLHIIIVLLKAGSAYNECNTVMLYNLSVDIAMLVLVGSPVDCKFCKNQNNEIDVVPMPKLLIIYNVM